MKSPIFYDTLLAPFLDPSWTPLGPFLDFCV